jgi:hypothetical protein
VLDDAAASLVLRAGAGPRGLRRALVTLARAEKNPEMKKDIVSKLANMKSKEATDYLLELLK